MAPVTLIVWKHRRDQTEDKKAIQIFSYHIIVYFPFSTRTIWKADRGGFDSEKQASSFPPK